MKRGMGLLLAACLCGGLFAGSVEDDSIFAWEATGSSTARICRFRDSSQQITSLVIPESIGGLTVTSIGEMAFSGCSGMTSVTIPASVTSIGYRTFSGCSELMAFRVAEDNPNYSSVKGLLLSKDGTTLVSGVNGCVTIPEGVTSIGDGAFYGCSGLTEVTIPESVTRIEGAAFLGCSGLTSVTIPKSVTSIGYSAFEGCNGLTAVTIPAGVTRIEWGAFRYCSGLTSVTIPDGVTAIEECAFEGCSRLIEVAIPDGVTSIGDGAFYGCSGLTEVTIPESVTHIESAAFLGCSGLTVVRIPDGVTSIGDNAFNGCSGLAEVTIPESVTRIEGAAFLGCSGLTSVTIPKSVTSIGYSAFEGCNGLTAVTIPAGVTRIEWGAFRYCSGLTSVTIPDGVTAIEECAFLGCSGLTTVTIPNGVTSIGYSAFSGCSGLTTTITIPKSVTSIADGAFRNCGRVEAFSVAKDNPSYSSVNGLLLSKDGTTLIRGINGRVTIPESVTRIKESAFEGCSGLTVVTIPSNVTKIGSDAFSSCSGLMAFQVAENNSYYSSVNGLLLSKDGATLIYGINGCVTIPSSVTSIGHSAFSGCSGLTSVTIPENVTGIGAYAFEGCSGLTSITIPGSVTNIANAVFKDCSRLLSVTLNGNFDQTMKSLFPTTYESLTNIVLGSGVTRIEWRAFRDCSGLTSVTIPDGVTSIGAYAFEGCSGLTSITIPERVTDFANAFGGCSGLRSVTLNGNFDQTMESLFPAAYESLTNIVLGSGVTDIGFSAFKGCSGLTSMTIPDSVTNIGYRAFYGCSGLTSVTLPNSVMYIDGCLFAGCGNIRDVIVNGNLSQPMRSLFPGSYKSLTNIVLGVGVTKINYYDFMGSAEINRVELLSGAVAASKTLKELFPDAYANLTEVVLGPEVTSLADGFFDGCSALPSRDLVSVAADAEGGGYVSGAGSYTLGETATLEAVPKDGYEFLYWTGDAGETMENPLVITADVAKQVTAHFAPLTPEFTSAESSTDGVTLRWRNLAWATEYRIYRAPTDEFPAKELATVAADGSCVYLDTTGEIGVSYFYWVQAVGASDVTESKDAAAGAKAKPIVYSPIAYENLRGAAHSNPATYAEGTALAFSAPGAVEGYTFTGWTPAAITAGMTGAQTVRANWRANAYRIVYAANGGTGETAPTDCAYDADAVVAESAFVREGYIFRGWATEEGGEVVYAPGAAVRNLTPDDGGTVTLYAVWEAVDKTKTYCVIDLSGGSDAANYPIFYLTDVPMDGWTDDYKTMRLVLRRIDGTNGTYYAGIFEVTEAQWANVMGGASRRTLPKDSVSYNTIRGDAETYDWPTSDAVAEDSFMGRLRRKTGLAALDLPSGDEWEFAARAGVTTDWLCSDSDANLGDYAWYEDNSDGTTHPVGELQPNAWGLYDVHGNLFEWCLDRYRSGPGYRMVCGGAYNYDASWCAFTWRYSKSPSRDWDRGGFRLFCRGDVGELTVHSPITYEDLRGAAHANPATYAEGTALAFSAPGAVEGYTFTGWTPAAITAGMTGAQTVRANWRANAYRIVYAANGGTGETAPTDCAYDADAAVAESAFVREGYIFRGWATEEGGEVVYAPGAAVRNLTSNDGGVVTLYAVWEAEAVADPVITPADGTVFRTASCTVTITCGTAGATIYCTTNGRTPRPTEANRYTGPFEVSGTTTVIAYAVRGERESELAEATLTYVEPEPLTIENALDEKKLAGVTTGGDAAWTPVEDAAAKAGESVARSGAVGMEQSSWLEATVHGRGTLTFWWKTSCEPDPRGRYTYDHVTFAADGEDRAKLDGETDWRQVSVTFGTDGAHTLRWTYSTDDWEESGYQDCAWVDGVSWTGSEAPAQAVPGIVGDADATVTGDVESGFTVTPSAESGSVEVSVPDGIDAAKVTVRVPPTVRTVKPHGAKVTVVREGHDITAYLDIPAADADGAVDLASATVRADVAREPLDPDRGAVIDLGDASAPSITTAPTKPGLRYTLREGTTLDAMSDGATKVGDGQPWTPAVTVKGGASGFYTIRVEK